MGTKWAQFETIILESLYRVDQCNANLLSVVVKTFKSHISKVNSFAFSVFENTKADKGAIIKANYA